MPPDIQLYNQWVDLSTQMLISLINGHNPVLDDNSGGMDGLQEWISLLREVVRKNPDSIRVRVDSPVDKGETGREWQC